MKASDLFPDEKERVRVKSLLDMFNGKITCVIENGKYLYKSIDKSKNSDIIKEKELTND